MSSLFASVVLWGRIGIAIALGGMTAALLLLGTRWPDAMRQMHTRGGAPDGAPMRQLARRLMASLAVVMLGLDVVFGAALVLLHRIAGWRARTSARVTVLTVDRAAEAFIVLALLFCTWLMLRALRRVWTTP